MEGRVNLPPKIMLDIFSRLPVNHLCRCKCLSRVCRSLLSDPDFVAKYNNNVFFQRRRLLFTILADSRPGIYSLNLDQLLNENPNVDAGGLVAAASTELDFVYDHLRHLARYWFPFVHGPCNGLFLSQLYFGDFSYSLVNPATKESKKLPKIPIWRRPMKPFSLQLYGLGFDPSTNEYKVINGQDYGDGIVFSVYTLQTDSWRQIDGSFPYKALGYDGIMVNGAVHWLVRKVADRSLVIISFTLAKEEFREIPVPPVPSTLSIKLGAFRTWLCITLVSKQTKTATEKKQITYNQFWVMNEYEVSESWITMQVSKPYKTLSHSGFWTESHDLMVFDRSSLVMYNFSDDKFWTLDVGKVGTFCNVGTYVESREPTFHSPIKNSY
ncbi:PREDICTED: F-box/kelch-repeat protein At3g06240-like [Fragaria vesca subsp. vesca]|uniref:F-box/kelch-repeat protein At3g06240-like n=1 Tax=Fragaria vesca subsp. vesca TaxID=101020 RepID=UPI0002C36194|nr:PREDICTED: F-box/kelch-repeat protein At3g06240-like [Fragaria vesca subsp. vesca]